MKNNVFFSTFFKVCPLWENARKNVKKMPINRWKIDEHPIPRGCENHAWENAAKKIRKSEPKGSKMEAKIHRKCSPRGGIKGEIRNTIRKWLPGWPQSLKMSQNWYQKWAIWGSKGVENRAKFKQNVARLSLIPVCGLLLPGPPNFPRCLTDAAPIRIWTWERAKRSGARLL